MKTETFLSDKQLSLRYNIGRSSVWRWLKEGKLPNPTRFGSGTTRWRLSDIEKWEDEK